MAGQGQINDCARRSRHRQPIENTPVATFDITTVENDLWLAGLAPDGHSEVNAVAIEVTDPLELRG